MVSPSIGAARKLCVPALPVGARRVVDGVVLMQFLVIEYAGSGRQSVSEQIPSDNRDREAGDAEVLLCASESERMLKCLVTLENIVGSCIPWTHQTVG